MKCNFCFAVIMLLVASALPASSQVPIDEDPVALAPQYTSVLLDNDRVRVYEERLQPGGRVPMHSHPPGVVYILNDATFLITLPDGSSEEVSVTRGQAGWREFTRHASENVGTTESHVLVIDMKE